MEREGKRKEGKGEMEREGWRERKGGEKAKKKE